MSHFFTTPAMRVENKAEIKDIGPSFSHFTDMTSYSNRPDYFNTKNLEQNFKGFYSGNYRWDYNGDYTSYFPNDILGFTCPVFESKNKTVSYYESDDKRAREIRTTSKIGKFIKKIAPYYNDKQVEVLVNIIVEDHEIPDFTYSIATSAKEIGEVYKTDASSGKYLDHYKCLNASCMRHEYEYQAHPTEVYGSGDFELHYITETDGSIAARVLICVVDNSHAPIYAAYETAGNELKRLIYENKIGLQDADYYSDPWEGARLLKIDHEGDCWVAPYMDLATSVKEEDDYFVITHRASRDYRFSTTDGTVTKRCKCAKCGKAVWDYNEFEGRKYCENCLKWCEKSEQFTLEEMVVVRIGTEYWNEIWKLSLAKEHATYDEISQKYYDAAAYKELLAERNRVKEPTTEYLTHSQMNKLTKWTYAYSDALETAEYVWTDIR